MCEDPETPTVLKPAPASDPLQLQPVKVQKERDHGTDVRLEDGPNGTALVCQRCDEKLATLASARPAYLPVRAMGAACVRH